MIYRQTGNRYIPSGAFCAVGAVLALRSLRFHADHKYKLKNL